MIRKSPLEYRTRPCVDCGTQIRVPVNQDGRMIRCRPCQKIYRNQVHYEYYHEQHTDNHNIGGAYKILHDPGETWTSHGSLDLVDLKKLAKAGFLDTGMRWSNGKRIYEVQGLALQEVK